MLFPRLSAKSIGPHSIIIWGDSAVRQAGLCVATGKSAMVHLNTDCKIGWSSGHAIVCTTNFAVF